jgi:ABC-type uncharacterized transport system permease subunit
MVALAHYTVRWGQLPLVGLAPALSTLSCLIGIALVAALLLREAARVGILLLPLMVILEGVALMLGVEPASTTLDFRGVWLAFHVVLAFIGLGGMAMAAAAGALYLVQFRELKSKHLGKLFQFLPPLATLDRLGRIGVVLGFTALTVAMIVAWAWTLSFRQTLAARDPETLWAIFIWTVVLSVLIARAGGGRVEQRSAVAGVVGFGLIVASYLLLRVTMGGSELFL